MSAQTAVQYLGESVAGLTVDTVPADVIEKARLALLHNLSVAVAGGTLATVASEWAKRKGTAVGGSRTLIAGLAMSAADAAFANACLIHARAQDDVFFPGLTHVGAATIPAVLALAEERGATLGDVLLAIVAGYEVAAAISVQTANLTTARKFRASGIYGVFGSAAAAAKLLGLDAEQTTNAIAIAASFAAGTNQTWVDGSLEWQFEIGAAARSGLEAALLAEAGGTGAPWALEGDSGFFASFAGDAHLGDAVVGSLDGVWRTREVTFKPYPVCAILQAPVLAATTIRPADGEILQSASLRLSPSEAHYPGTEGQAPFVDAGAALMSASYCLAVALQEGTVVADDLFRSAEPQLIELSRRIRVIADDSLTRQSFVLEVDYGGAEVHRVEHVGDGTTFNWNRDELMQNVLRLVPEVPAGIDLERLAAQCFADPSSDARRVVDAAVVAAR